MNKTEKGRERNKEKEINKEGVFVCVYTDL